MFKRNVKAVVVAGRDGVMEIGDMTEGERRYAQVGTAMVVGGTVSLGVIKVVGVGVAGLACAKGLVVGGTVVAVGAFGKAFVRGAVEGYRTEMVKAEAEKSVTERQMDAGYLVK